MGKKINISKEFLEQKYVVEQISPVEIAQLLNVSVETIRAKLKKFRLYNKELSNKIRSKKTFGTIKKRYGVDNIGQLEETKLKVKKTCKERYGVTNVSHIPQVVEKIKNTQENHYGKWYLQTEEYLDKNEKTCLKKYGVTNVSKDKDIHRKKIVTMH